MRRDGMNPLTGNALAEARMKSGPSAKGVDFRKYNPEHSMERFLRLRQAKFNYSEFDRLGEMTYDRMIELKWMERADNKAEYDRAKRERDNHGRG
jgi:hypothetical protein